MGRQMAGSTGGQVGEWIDGWTEAQMDGWTVLQMDGWLEYHAWTPARTVFCE